jgi:hypothetical protein
MLADVTPQDRDGRSSGAELAGDRAAERDAPPESARGGRRAAGAFLPPQEARVPSSALSPLSNMVDEDGREDHGTNCDLLPERGHVQKHEAVAN